MKLFANYFAKIFHAVVTSIDFETVNIYVVKMERKTKKTLDLATYSVQP